METEAEKSKTCPCKCGKHGAVVLILLLIAGVICWHIHRPHHHPPHPLTPSTSPIIGAECTVHFHRNAIGMDEGYQRLNRINGVDISIRGRVQDIDHDAILLDYDGTNEGNREWLPFQLPRPSRLWIPKSSILFIEYEKKVSPMFEKPIHVGLGPMQ